MSLRTSLLAMAASALLGCATTATTVKAPESAPRITAKAYAESCEPTEKYYVSQFGAKVFRHTNNCLGFNDLLTVVWSSPKTPTSIQGAKLMAVAFAQHLNDGQVGIISYVNMLAVDSLQHDGVDYHVCFFDLRHKKEDPDAS